MKITYLVFLKLVILFALVCSYSESIKSQAAAVKETQFYFYSIKKPDVRIKDVTISRLWENDIATNNGFFSFPSVEIEDRVLTLKSTNYKSLTLRINDAKDLKQLSFYLIPDDVTTTSETLFVKLITTFLPLNGKSLNILEEKNTFRIHTQNSSYSVSPATWNYPIVNRHNSILVFSGDHDDLYLNLNDITDDTRIDVVLDDQFGPTIPPKG